MQGFVSEADRHIFKIALLYRVLEAAGEGAGLAHAPRVIDARHVRKACEILKYTLAGSRVAFSFIRGGDKDTQDMDRVRKILFAACEQWVKYRDLLRGSHLMSRRAEEVLYTLCQSGEVESGLPHSSRSP